MKVITIRVKDQEGLTRFEDWCEQNGVAATKRIVSVETGSLLYYFDLEGMMGIYQIAEDDVPLVKLRWDGAMI